MLGRKSTLLYRALDQLTKRNLPVKTDTYHVPATTRSLHGSSRVPVTGSVTNRVPGTTSSDQGPVSGCVRRCLSSDEGIAAPFEDVEDVEVEER